jgi:hypothetical protein
VLIERGGFFKRALYWCDYILGWEYNGGFRLLLGQSQASGEAL